MKALENGNGEEPIEIIFNDAELTQLAKQGIDKNTFTAFKATLSYGSQQGRSIKLVASMPTNEKLQTAKQKIPRTKELQDFDKNRSPKLLDEDFDEARKITSELEEHKKGWDRPQK